MVSGSVQEYSMTPVWVIVVRMNTFGEEAYELANHQMHNSELCHPYCVFKD